MKGKKKQKMCLDDYWLNCQDTSNMTNVELKCQKRSQ